jgi:hypothetical protein
LILVIPMGHRFAVIGDNAWAEVVGPAYWEELSNAMSRHLRAGRRYEALAYGIRTWARRWRAHGRPTARTPTSCPMRLFMSDVAKDSVTASASGA